MALNLNNQGLEYAKKLIHEGKIDLETKWSDALPSSEESDAFIDRNGWGEYRKWFLGLENTLPEDEKQHYEFPFGDFKKVYREGVISAKRRAAQYKHHEIESAADELLQMIDK